MKRRKHSMTKYIQLDSMNCKACWKCVEICTQKVFGKIDIIIHKHSKINEPDKCIGCMKCADGCEYKAIKPNFILDKISRNFIN